MKRTNQGFFKPISNTQVNTPSGIRSIPVLPNGKPMEFFKKYNAVTKVVMFGGRSGHKKIAIGTPVFVFCVPSCQIYVSEKYTSMVAINLDANPGIDFDFE